MANKKKKNNEDQPIVTPSSPPEKEDEVENSVSEESHEGKEAQVEEEEEASQGEVIPDSDSDFVESSKNHKRKRNKSLSKPKKSKAKSRKIIKKRRFDSVERKWSDEDEIVILEGMREWKNKGWIPLIAIEEFIENYGKSLHVSPVTKRMLTAKISLLKERFCKFLKKKSDDDDVLEPVLFEDPHDYRMYLIMKDIWGDENPPIRRRSVKIGDDNKGKKKNVEAKRELLDNLHMLGIREFVSKEALNLLGDSKLMEFEIKWKQLHRKERELNSKRMKLIEETTQAVIAAAEESLKD